MLYPKTFNGKDKQSANASHSVSSAIPDMS